MELKKKEVINLSDIIGESCANSFALAFRSMFCTEVTPKNGMEKKLIVKYLKEYASDLYPYFNENMKRYFFVTDSLKKKREELVEKLKIKRCEQPIDNVAINDLFKEQEKLSYTQLFNCGIYNLGMMLSFIDDCLEIDWEIVYNNSEGDYEAGDLLIVEKMDMLAWINLGISSFVIEHNQEINRFNWNKHYNVAPNMQYIIRNQRKYQCCKEGLISKNHNILLSGNCFLSDILLLIDLYRVRKQCILEKVMIAFLFIAKSPEYDIWMQEYAYTIIDILNEIMFCGEIHQIYLQEGYYNLNDNSEKTSNDATTRLSIIFSTSNDDFYILRVDLPHKGEETFHINIEEVIGETIIPTGYPFAFEDISDMKLELDAELFHELFFVLNGQVWFKSRFESILKKNQVISNDSKHIIEKLFHDQAHIQIKCHSVEFAVPKKQIALIDEIKKYIRRLSISDSHYLVFGKGDIEYAKEIKKMRNLFYLENEIMKLIYEIGDKRVNIGDVVDLFEKNLKFRFKNKDDSDVSSIVEIWDIIKEM